LQCGPQPDTLYPVMTAPSSAPTLEVNSACAMLRDVFGHAAFRRWC
jgi:hypothetical protein